MKKKLDKKIFFDLLYYIIGSALVAISVSIFAAPNDIVAGGFSGIATILNSLFALPIGTTVLVMNIPVFVIGARFFGIKFLYKSLIATALMSIFMDVFSQFIPFYKGDKLLCAIFGGVISGIGLALVFIRGATTGGVDIIAKVVNIKTPHVSVGNMILMLDTVVVILSAIVYRNIESALHAVVFLFAQAKTIDWLVYGTDRGKVLLISSSKYNQISDEIMNTVHRGVTVIEARGAYSGKTSPLIYCAVRPFEVAALHNIVREIDKKAFVVTVDAGEILGEGFKDIHIKN